MLNTFCLTQTVARLAIAVAVLSASCPAAHSQFGWFKTADTLEELFSGYNVERKGSETLVVLKQKVIWSVENEFRQLAVDMESLGKWLQTVPKEENRIIYSIEAKTTDKYGNARDEKIFSVSIDPAEIRKINFKVVHTFKTLEFVTLGYLSPAAHEEAADFCKNKGNLFPDFCTQIHKRIRR